MSQDEQGTSYYSALNLTSWATAQQIRQSYREMSKRYHPDTTDLPPAVATAKFQQINEAYATLSNPERRKAYDLKIGYSRIAVIQAPDYLNRPMARSRHGYSRSAYLDPTDRSLSPGEIFAVFILGLTFAACLLLVIAIGLARGDSAFQPLSQAHDLPISNPSSTALEPALHPVLAPSILPEALHLNQEQSVPEALPQAVDLPTQPAELQAPSEGYPMNASPRFLPAAPES